MPVPQSLLPPESLHGEIVVLHGNVVFELLQAQDGAAVAAQVGHLEDTGSRDTLHAANTSLVQTAYELVLDEVLVLCRDVIVLAYPDSREGILRRLALARTRFD